MAAAAFDTWLDTYLDEAGIDTEQHAFDVTGPTGVDNYIPLGCVIEACKAATPDEQAAIRNTIVRIDYGAGDPLHYFKYLAQGIAL